MFDPFPSDHDDDDGGPSWRDSRGVGMGFGRRVAASAGNGGGGRAGVFAVDDAVSHARRLYVHGSVFEAVARDESGDGGERVTGSGNIEPHSLSTCSVGRPERKGRPTKSTPCERLERLRSRDS